MLRGGAFKPRTSPYSFQGLEHEGLKLLAQARQETGLPIVTEILSPENVELVAEYADVMQVGARNMQNFSLLKKLGTVDRPVLLKRGMMCTIKEALMSAEYILSSGNPSVILCERGIRSFENSTRNTLDLSAVALIKEWSHLPAISPSPSSRQGQRSALAESFVSLFSVFTPPPPWPTSGTAFRRSTCDGGSRQSCGQRRPWLS